MKPLHLIPLTFALASCGLATGVVEGATANISAPMQIGDRKYKILYEGSHASYLKSIYEEKAIPLSQQFCRSQGYDHAEVSYARYSDYEFFCMRPGDRLTQMPQSYDIKLH